jgi:type I restriction enzyme S subunit
LEESARLLYQEWFVRLCFPGHEHARLTDGIPAGWERKYLGNICAEVRETILPEELEANTPYIGLEHMPRRSISLTEWGQAESVTSSKHRFKAGDILFGKIRPYFHKVGIAFTDGVASSDAIVIRPSPIELRSFVLMTVSSDKFVAEASQTMREGSKMPRADWKLMKKFPLALPPKGLLTDFTDVVSNVTDQLRNLCFQNQKLRAARDLLLPRLMSGEIVV